MNAAQLLVATWNEDKLREIRALLCNLPVDLLSLADFSKIGVVAETGSTFTENAALKASGYAQRAGVLTLADDSGLEVEALGGAPGVFSARYLSEHASYPDRIHALLTELEGVSGEERSARFVCAIAISSGSGEILHTIQATCEGRIATVPHGSGGFGYDPVFIPAGFDQTFAELSSDLKSRISHRSRALAIACELLPALTVTSTAG